MHEELNKERLGRIVLNVYDMWKRTGDKKVTSAIKHNINPESEDLESRFIFDLLTKNFEEMINIWEHDETESSDYESILNGVMEVEGVSNNEDLIKKSTEFRAENLHNPLKLSQEEIDRKLEERLKELENE